MHRCAPIKAPPPSEQPEESAPLPDRSAERLQSLLEEAEARGGATPVSAAAFQKYLAEIIALRDKSPAEAASIADQAL